MWCTKFQRELYSPKLLFAILRLQEVTTLFLSLHHLLLLLLFNVELQTDSTEAPQRRCLIEMYHCSYVS